MKRNSLDGLVTSNQSLGALVEAGRLEPDKVLAVSLKPNELAQALGGEVDQFPENNRTRRTTAKPADKPIMAKRPFQISA